MGWSFGVVGSLKAWSGFKFAPSLANMNPQMAKSVQPTNTCHQEKPFLHNAFVTNLVIGCISNLQLVHFAHTLIVLSWLPEASVLPSGLYATDFTKRVCPSSVARSRSSCGVTAAHRSCQAL